MWIFRGAHVKGLRASALVPDLIENDDEDAAGKALR